MERIYTNGYLTQYDKKIVSREAMGSKNLFWKKFVRVFCLSLAIKFVNALIFSKGSQSRCSHSKNSALLFKSFD